MDEKKREGITIPRIYYAHGLVCASYPGSVICSAAVIVILCSLPFFITTSGDVNFPKPWRSPWLNYRLPSHVIQGSPHEPAGEWIINNASLMSVRTPLWFLGLPCAIVYQIYVHVNVDCYHFNDLCQRSYYKVSKTASALMLDTLQQADKACGSVLHPAVVKFAHLLSNNDTPPLSFSSSVLSPLLDSMYQETSGSKELNMLKQNLSLHSIKELLYGGFWEESHIMQQERSPDQSSSGHRFAVTVILQPTIDNFVQLVNCVDTLNGLWRVESSKRHFMKHFYYESEWSLSDFAPLLFLYSIVFLYITFSVGKIDLVRSKFGLGFSAVITVICSLTMSLGICAFFGLSITVSGSEIFPFVVVVIGLENILIITKAVISTDPGFDVKFRIAEGLSREGKALTNNLVTVLCLLVLGIFTFNYAMKEFCIIALVGLLCDFFLQLVFFTTVLSIDMRRMELLDLKFSSHGNRPLIQHQEKTRRIPRRDRVNNFLVRGRYAQKIMMVLLIAYLTSVFSRTEMFHSIVRSITNSSSPSHPHNSPIVTPSPLMSTSIKEDNILEKDKEKLVLSLPTGALLPGKPDLTYYVNSWIDEKVKEKAIVYRSEENGFDLWCGEATYCWRPMVTTHWPHLLQYYNIAVESKFITVLPPVMLNYHLGFTAQKLFNRSIQDKDLLQTLQDTLLALISIPNVLRGMFLLIIGLIGLIYFTYLAVQARTLAEDMNLKRSESHQLVRVFKMSGHAQDIECLGIDGGFVVTVGLDGIIHIWDIGMRQRYKTIDRKEIIEQKQVQDNMSRYIEGCENPDVLTPAPSVSSLIQQPIPSAPPLLKQPTPAIITTSSQPHPQTPTIISPPVSFTVEKPIAVSDSTPNSTITTPSSTTGPIPIPQRYFPNFLRRFSMPSMPTLLRKSPEKRDPVLVAGFPSYESIPEHVETSSSITDSSLPESPPQILQPSSPVTTVSEDSCQPSPSLFSPSLIPSNFSPTTNSSRRSSTSSLSGTKPITVYSKPLVSSHEVVTRHKRSASADSNFNQITRPHLPHETMSIGSQWSIESISLHSENLSELSYETAALGPPLSPAASNRYNDNSFQFKQHFSVFSQYTSDLALEHCDEKLYIPYDDDLLSPIWCMDTWNGTIAVGCGNGQIEAWNSHSGMLKFFIHSHMSGITVIKIHPIGVISGHLDGSLNLINHHGHMMHGVSAHSKPISTLTYIGDYVITGSYDATIKIFGVHDFICLRTLSCHKGRITSLVAFGSQFCVSGCSSGLICYWNIQSGKLLLEFDCQSQDDKEDEKTIKGGVVRVCCSEDNIIALMRDSSVRIWKRETGYLSNIIEMGGYTHDIALLDPGHLAIALESQIVIYDILSRHEVSRKQLETSLNVPIIRHLTPLESSTLICSSGRDLQLVPSGLKIKSD